MTNKEYFKLKREQRKNDIIIEYKKSYKLKNIILKYKNRHYCLSDILNDLREILIIDDDLMIDLFFLKNKINPSLLYHFSKYNITKIEKDIINYLNNRYNDSSSIKETLYRIKFKIDKHPLCAECHRNPVHFTNNRFIFTKFCSKKCSRNNEESKSNYKNTLLSLYGDVNYNNSEKNKRTCMEKYGKTNVFATDWCKNKIKKYWNDKYGVDNANQVKDITRKHNYKELIKKGLESKRKNKTFNTSKPEDECYKLLCDKFGESDIERQYNKDERYPFNCDFYIKSKDIFIEYNGIWTHGKHPYNQANDQDNKILSIWKERSKTKKFYKVAINVWTKYDPKKRMVAKESKINFYELWTITDVNEFLKQFN